MQLPAFFGRRKTINLLPRDSFESSQLGYILSWVLIFGKWAVIITQLIVMGAFLWRFSLDRQLTDLNKAIAKNVAVAKSYEQVEREFVLAQKRLNKAEEILREQNKTNETFALITARTPLDVWYEKIAVNPQGLTISAYSKSLLGFGNLLNNLQSDKRFESISINKIQDSGSQNAQIQFEIAMKYAQEKKKK